MIQDLLRTTVGWLQASESDLCQYGGMQKLYRQQHSGMHMPLEIES